MSSWEAGGRSVPGTTLIVRAEVVWKCPVDDVAVASVGSLAEVG